MGETTSLRHHISWGEWAPPLNVYTLLNNNIAAIIAAGLTRGRAITGCYNALSGNKKKQQLKLNFLVSWVGHIKLPIY